MPGPHRLAQDKGISCMITGHLIAAQAHGEFPASVFLGGILRSSGQVAVRIRILRHQLLNDFSVNSSIAESRAAASQLFRNQLFLKCFSEPPQQHPGRYGVQAVMLRKFDQA